MRMATSLFRQNMADVKLVFKIYVYLITVYMIGLLSRIVHKSLFKKKDFICLYLFCGLAGEITFYYTFITALQVYVKAKGYKCMWPCLSISFFS